MAQTPPQAQSHQAHDQTLDPVSQVDHVVAHFETLEAQYEQVRQGLTHSHRLTTLGTLTAVLAHEYNNILTPMITYAQLALARPDDPKLMKKAVEKALACAERATRISSSLLGLAREDAGDEHADLRHVADEAVTCLCREPSRDGIELHVDVPAVSVAMPSVSLEQVLLNLLLNARKALLRSGQRGGKLSITAERFDREVRLTVADNGPGIPPEIMDRLFEPFVTVQAKTSTAASGETPSAPQGASSSGTPAEKPEHRSQPKGTGLGLCICKDLVEAAGGTIRAESAPEAGTQFHITLSLAE